MPDADDTEQVEIFPESIAVKSGDILHGDGSVEPALWMEANGRRLHTNDQLRVYVFFTPEQAEAHALAIIKEVAVMQAMANLPMIVERPDG